MPEADRAKWDARHASEADDDRGPPRWLEAHDALLPRVGQALDIAAGTGRISRWAAARGLSVTAVDISAVGLAKVGETVPSARLVVRDLELEPVLPRGPYALVACFLYRQPALWPAMVAVLEPGGVLVAEVSTVTNLERHAHPSRRWLVESDELVEVAAGLEILVDEDGWFDDRHLARLIARKRSG